MDFGSNYIFVGDDEQDEDEVFADKDSSYGACHDEPYTGHVYGFECEIMEDEENENETPVTFMADQHEQPRNKINTNTISLKMSSLKEPPEATFYSEPIRCENSKCGAFYSDIDNCKEGEPWICKFCQTKNKANQWPDIKMQDVLYAQQDNLPDMEGVSNETTIILVIDVSGSMGRTLQIYQMSDTLQEIVNSEYADYVREMSQIVGMEIVVQPNVRITEVSWLQAVKAALIDQLVQLKEKYLRENKPQPKVGLITFGDVVTLYKDGWAEPIPIEGGQLADYNELYRLGAANYQLGSLADTGRSIETCIRKLKCDGQTALGPALVVAQGMVNASKGSKIIICTDGIANIGIGNLENSTLQDIEDFYRLVITNGNGSGTSISVLSFDNCKMDRLGPVAEATGGIVDLIKPTELGSRLKDELNRSTIATNALIKFIVHKSMFIQVLGDEHRESTLDYSIGNIQMDKMVPFCFAPRSADNPQQSTDPTDAALQDYPFQVQIYFTDLKGHSAWRVWTKCRPVTKSRQEAQRNMNRNTVVDSLLQNSASALLNLKEKPTEFKIEARKIADKVNTLLRERSQTIDGQMNNNRLMDFLKVVNDIGNNQTSTIREDILTKLFKIQSLRPIGH